jgi:CheY-like chemotaxis protein
MNKSSSRRRSPGISAAVGAPTVLIADDNRDLLRFLERLMADAGWKILTAESASEARHLLQEKPNAALLDYTLPDGNGVELGVEFLQSAPHTLVIVMTGTVLPAEEEALCEEHNLPVLRKPFLASDVMNQIRSRIGMRPGSAGEVEATQGRALKVFVSYSHRDEVWQKRLDKHLSTLKHMGIIHSWHDRQIVAGDDFGAAIDKYLNMADLILLLISPDFLGSDYCYRKEMSRALERHRRHEARVIPVIVRPVDWEKAPFSHLQAVPKDGKAVTLWANRDQALMDAAKSIRKAAEELSGTIRRG